MRYKRVNIDSLNLSSETMESIFFYHQNYTIEPVKSRSVFNPKVWSKTFGKSLTQNIIEAKIIHTSLGLTLPLKTFSATPERQTLEFAGLYGYNERSELLLQHLRELESQLQNAKVSRLDVAIDFNGNVPPKIIKTLCRHREPFQCKNSTYYKTPKEKRTNRVMDIKIYNKSLHAGLNKDMMRLEFCFKSAYLKKLLLKDIENIYPKIEKTIKRLTGLSIKINPLFSLEK